MPRLYNNLNPNDHRISSSSSSSVSDCDSSPRSIPAEHIEDLSDEDYIINY